MIRISSNFFKNSLLCKRIGILFLGALLASTMSCAIKPTPIPDIVANTKQDKSISVFSPDPLAADTLCSSLKKTTYFNVVRCNPPEETASDFTIDLETRVLSSSSDLGRNLGYSLATLTTLLLVSTSGEMEYAVTLRRGDSVIKRFSLLSEGRIGMWAIQPLWTGFFGSLFGTILNGDKLPDRLQLNCLQPPVRTASESCSAYQDFITDSFAKVWKVTWNTLLTEIDPVNGPKIADKRKL